MKGKAHRFVGTKEVNFMELSPSQRKTIKHQFDSFCKKVLAGEAKDCKKEIVRRMQHEIYFCELSPQEMDHLCVMDDYSTDSCHFSVYGNDVSVKDGLISTALIALPSKEREIVLLSYFFDMTDREIGKMMNLARRTVQYQRVRTLKQLKKLLGGNSDE